MFADRLYWRSNLKEGRGREERGGVERDGKDGVGVRGQELEGRVKVCGSTWRGWGGGDSGERRVSGGKIG